jgi:hypothetical protein
MVGMNSPSGPHATFETDQSPVTVVGGVAYAVLTPAKATTRMIKTLMLRFFTIFLHFP